MVLLQAVTPEEEGREYGRSLLRLIDYCEEHFMQEAGATESLTMRKVQFYVRTTHVWLEFGHSLMAKCSSCQNLAQLREAVALFFEIPQSMSARTELRQ